MAFFYTEGNKKENKKAGRLSPTLSVGCNKLSSNVKQRL